MAFVGHRFPCCCQCGSADIRAKCCCHIGSFISSNNKIAQLLCATVVKEAKGNRSNLTLGIISSKSDTLHLAYRRLTIQANLFSGKEVTNNDWRIAADFWHTLSEGGGALATKLINKL